MTPAEAEFRLYDFYATYFQHYGPVPVPGSPGSRVAESEEVAYLWSIVEKGDDDE